MNLLYLRKRLPRVRNRHQPGTRPASGQAYQQRGNRWYM